MKMLTNTPITYKPRAFYATLDYRTHGVALRTAEGRVHFCEDGTGLWTELFDRDAARLQLHGRVDLVKAVEIEGHNLVVACSKTLTKVAA